MATLLDLLQEVLERLLDPDPQAVPERALQGPRVGGNRRDRLHHLVRDVVQSRAQDLDDLGRQLMPRLIGQNSYPCSKIWRRNHALRKRKLRAAARNLCTYVSRIHKVGNLVGVAVPPLCVVVAIVLLWNRAIGPLELSLMVGLYVITALGITLGFHRMFTHRAFEASRAFRAIVAVLGSMAVEGSVITWVADHRKHHAFTDIEGDPHSPHLAGPGFLGAIKGLWHAHIGWLFETVGTAERERFAPDLVKDRALQVVDKLFFLWVALGLVIPFALGWIIGGGVGTALDRAAVGRAGAGVPAAPRDLVDQLGLPLLRAQAL